MGIQTNTTLTCSVTPPSGYAANNADCKDNNASVYPNASEVCNGLDENCNGQIDEGLALNTYYRDFDNDTYGSASNNITTCNATPPAGYVNVSGDCNDNNTLIHPGAAEACGNGIDEDCSGSDLSCGGGRGGRGGRGGKGDGREKN